MNSKDKIAVITLFACVIAISVLVPVGIVDLARPELAPPVYVIYPEKKDPPAYVSPSPEWASAEDSLLTPAQLEWRDALAQCESSGNPFAVNPIDRDGTASHGLYQFKPSTLIATARAYLTIHIDEGNVMQAIYDPIVQNAALAQMIHHRDEIDWHTQFPACVARLGIPPEKPTCEAECPLIDPNDPSTI